MWTYGWDSRSCTFKVKTYSLESDTNTHAGMQMINTVMALTSGQHTSLSGVMSKMYCALALPWKDTNVRISSSSSAVWSVDQSICTNQTKSPWILLD